MTTRPSNWRRGLKSRFFVPSQCECLLCSDEFCSLTLKFGDGPLSIFRFQSFDGVLNHGDSPATFKQTFGRETNAIFGDHAKDYEFRVRTQARYKLPGVPTLKDVERLFFQENLLVLRKIVWQRCRGLVRYREDLVGQRLRNKLGTAGSFDAMRWKRLEFGIVLGVVATMGNQKDAALSSSVRKPSDVRKQSFGAGHIELAARQHEISLGIDFPENEIAR